MSKHDFSYLNGWHVLDRAASIFDVGTRASRINAAQDSKIIVTCDKPVGQLTRKLKKNTYQLGPRETFKPSTARDIGEKIVDKWIAKDTMYSADWARITAKAIAGDIENLLKKLSYARYKFVVQVFIGQKKGQGVECCSRFLSNVQTDSFCEFSYQNDTLWCVGLISAVYYE